MFWRAIQAHRFDQTQLNLLDTEMVLRLAVKIPQHFRCELGLGRFATQIEMFSTPCDGDIQRGFDLLEVFVQCPAQVGKALVIGWRKRNFDGMGFQRCNKTSIGS